VRLIGGAGDWIETDATTILAGAVYTASVWIDVFSGGGSWQLDLIDDSAGVIGSSVYTSAGGYERASVTGTTDLAATTLKLRLTRLASGTTTFIDDMQAERGAVATDWVNPGTSGAVGTYVTLDFGVTEAGFASKVTQVIQVDADDGGLPYRFLIVSRDGSGTYTAQVLDSRDATGIVGETVLGTDYYVCATSVSGLEHLEGQTVTALADGNVIEDLVVSGGGVSFGDNVYVAIAHVGLPYNSDFESLAAHGERGRQKIVERVLIELEHTRGGSVGTTPTTQPRPAARTSTSRPLASGPTRRTSRFVSPRLCPRRFSGSCGRSNMGARWRS
jgi:hypothetical protein